MILGPTTVTPVTNKNDPNVSSMDHFNVSRIFSIYIVIIVFSLAFTLTAIGYINVKKTTLKSYENFAEIELNLFSSLFNIYIDNHLAALADHAKSPIIINSVMTSGEHNPTLDDVLNEIRLVGKDASFAVIDINNVITQKDKDFSTLNESISTRISEVITEKIDSYFYFKAHHSDNSKLILGLIVPILYNGLSEGALISEVDIDINRILKKSTAINNNVELAISHKKETIYRNPHTNTGKSLIKISPLSNGDSFISVKLDLSYTHESMKNLAITTLFLSSLFMAAFLLVFHFIGRKLFIEPGEIIQKERIKTGNLNKQLVRTNEDLNQFVYVASHDLKSPLLAISQLSEWVVEDCEKILPAESKKHLQLLTDRTTRMQYLLDDLLEYSRVGRFNYEVETFSFTEIVTQAFEPLNNASNFKLHCKSVPETITLPKVPLEIVLRNCISNAIKHHHENQGEIHVSCEIVNDTYRISIMDDGPGIAKNLHEKAFEMFQTLQPRDEVEGSGMGLAIIKKLVQNYDGKVLIESDAGNGTTIKTIWPILKDYTHAAI